MPSEESYLFFWFVTFCGMFTAFIPFIVRMVLQVISQETEMESNLRRQVCDLKAELGGMSIVDEFAKYAKIQRKINKMSEELAHQAQLKSMYMFKVRLAATALLYALMVSLDYLQDESFKSHKQKTVAPFRFYNLSPFHDVLRILLHYVVCVLLSSNKI